MHHATVRMIFMAIAAVAIGAGAGVAFLHAFSANASPPPAALSPQLTPPEEAARLPLRPPAAVRETVPGAARRGAAPPAQSAPIREKAPQGSKNAPPFRTKITLRTPGFDIGEESVSEAMGKISLGRYHLHW
jgi:hypothetical protein